MTPLFSSFFPSQSLRIPSSLKNVHVITTFPRPPRSPRCELQPPIRRRHHLVVLPIASSPSSRRDDTPSAPPSIPRNLFLQPAVVIALASLVSKAAGVVREAQLAATFGLQPAYDAYGYASILPAYLLSIYGGLNGPVHQAVTVALAARSVANSSHHSSIHPFIHSYQHPSHPCFRFVSVYITQSIYLHLPRFSLD